MSLSALITIAMPLIEGKRKGSATDTRAKSWFTEGLAMSAIWKQSRKIPPTKLAKAVSFGKVFLLAFLLHRPNV